MAHPLDPAVKRIRISPRARRNILVGLLATLAFGLAFLAAAWSRACAGNTCPSIEELGGYDPSQRPPPKLETKTVQTHLTDPGEDIKPFTATSTKGNGKWSTWWTSRALATSRLPR